MSFNTHAGTRGARLPSGPFFRWMNNIMSRRLRRKGGTMMGFNALILTTTGARSGARRTNPVGWFPGPDGSWLIVASANGAARNPAWYYNVAAHPDEVTVEMEGRTIAVTAEQLHGAERDKAWQQITATAPRFAQYEQKTLRVLLIHPSAFPADAGLAIAARPARPVTARRRHRANDRPPGEGQPAVHWQLTCLQAPPQL